MTRIGNFFKHAWNSVKRGVGKAWSKVKGFGQKAWDVVKKVGKVALPVAGAAAAAYGGKKLYDKAKPYLPKDVNVDGHNVHLGFGQKLGDVL